MSWDAATLDRVMCDQSSEMLLVVDPKSLNIISANRQAEVTLGYEATPLVGRSITEVESSLADIFYWEDVRMGGGSDIDNAESMYICGDGVALPVIKSIRRLRGDFEDVLVLRVRDGASLKRGEAQLAALSGQLQATLESIWEGILVLDSAGQIVNMNRRFSAMWEIPEAVLLQDSEAIIACLMDKLSTPWELQDDFDAFSQQAGHEVCEITKLKNGRLFERRARPQMDRGEVIGLVYSFHDISDFVHARQEAEEASRSKSRFLANMSHEIRTPMNAILGLLKLLQRTELSTRQRDYASKTEGAARSLLGLLNDILDFSKVEAGKLALDPQPHALTQVFRDLSVILAANVGAKPVDLLFDLDPQLPPLLQVDALRLLQVLINLAGNALKFTARGEVVVGVKLLQRDAEAARLEFTVTDTGIGIAPEHHAKIFSGFSQAETSTTRQFGGTGLGLAISMRLLELMGGQITLQSALGQGSRFSFQLDLPLVQAEGEPGVSAPRPASPRQGLALLIDDNARARDVLRRLLTAEGWQVVAAASVAEAQALMAASAPDGLALNLALVDALLPGEDVWACLAQLRAQPGLAELPIVMSGTALQLEALTQGEQAQLSAFLVKPLMALALREALSPDKHAAAASAQLGAASASAELAPLAGIRLLVVEDNLNNQQVAQELLEDAGATVRLASNGQEAVDFMRAEVGSVDLLLMDVQMPVMDGYTATRILREELGLRLPIVAMTANAMASDRDDCLAAGMDEHVGKPFDLDRLVHLIRKLCRPTSAGSEEASASAAPKFATLQVPAPLLERALGEGIQIQLAVDRFMGKAAMYQRTVLGFATSASELPGQVEAALHAGDLAAAQLQVHACRGMAAILGAERLAQFLDSGETQLEQGNAPDAAWLATLPEQLQATVAALRELAEAVLALPAPT
ncbi:PAS domain-containing hybrid sensor histidine kinase/response regulator [Roseateles sp. PN1]|uniref:PAS domain-containing hybrid sensor histidine kinase/response regulator n=1 Tax=Roseateles sp. PN1 TaxID=3137372 RepID=UPI0031393329